MYPFQSAFTPITPKELSVSDTTFKVFILPHFTGLTDRLPYGSGGFLLFQDSVVPVGIEPTTHRFSVCCSTDWATIPAPVYLCKGGGSTDTIIPLFCGPGRTRTSINWLTVNRNNLYTTKPILTTTWLLSNFQGSYHSIIVVQGVTHPSSNFTSLESG
jgi:hypothetical protein